MVYYYGYDMNNNVIMMYVIEQLGYYYKNGSTYIALNATIMDTY